MNEVAAPCSGCRPSPTTRTASHHLVDIAVLSFAEACAIDVLARDARLTRIAEAPDAGSVGLRAARLVEGDSWIPDNGRAEIVREAGGADESAIIVPVLLHGRVLGRMVFASRSRAFTVDDLPKADSFARLAAVAIPGSRLRRSARHVCRGCEQVLGTIVHDLRSPLAVMQLSLSLMQARDGAEVAGRLLGVADRNVKLMTALVEDLLDATTARSGSLRVTPAPEKVCAIVDDTVASFALLAQPRSISVVCDHDDPDAIAYCDRKRVLQVLANLMGNAVKFTRAGGAIKVSTRLTEGEVRVDVADTGRGISDEDRLRVFERFWSGGEGSWGGGVGLGLAIAKGIVDAHGGRIGVLSRPHEGTTFWFTLPTSPSRSRARRA